MSFLEKKFPAGRLIVLLCVTLVFTITAARAQTSKIVLPDRQVTLSELFGEIRRQTGYTVVFDAGSIPPEQKITLAAQTGSVTELLDGALPKTLYAWRTVDNFIVVRTLPTEQTVALPAQPTQAEFESDIREYTRRNIQLSEAEAVVRYDTVRTVKPHNGIFDYPAREFLPVFTTHAAHTPFERTTPPMFAVKTNLVWWAVNGTLNIGGEVGLGKRTSLELSGGINRRNLEGSAEDNKKLTHWVIKPEFRYWLCERFTTGHFFGVHGIYGEYNVGGYDVPMLFEKEFRYEGKAYGGGINYGYNWAWSKHWGMEFTAGVGVLMMDYVKKDCVKCGAEVGSYEKTYVGPTELGVKLIFMIK